MKSKITSCSRLLTFNLIMFLILFPSCKGEKEPEIEPEAEIKEICHIVFMIGNVTIIGQDNLSRKAELLETLQESDIIKTGEKSQVTIQIKDLGILRILENSEIKLESISDIERGTNINLEKGSIFSKLSKIKKDKHYIVHTPTTVASVRGTEFLTYYSEKTNKSRISLKKGRVQYSVIEKNENLQDVIGKTDKAFNLNPGTAVVVDEKLDIDTEIQTDVEKLELKKLSIQEYTENLEEKSPEEMNRIFKSILEKEKLLDEKIDQMYEKVDFDELSPLSRLKKDGKILTKFYMNDGSRIIGSIISQNRKSIKLDTGDGQISIPKEDIKRRKFLR